MEANEIFSLAVVRPTVTIMVRNEIVLMFNLLLDCESDTEVLQLLDFTVVKN